MVLLLRQQPPFLGDACGKDESAFLGRLWGRLWGGSGVALGWLLLFSILGILECSSTVSILAQSLVEAGVLALSPYRAFSVAEVLRLEGGSPSVDAIMLDVRRTVLYSLDSSTFTIPPAT